MQSIKTRRKIHAYHVYNTKGEVPLIQCVYPPVLLYSWNTVIEAGISTRFGSVGLESSAHNKLHWKTIIFLLKRVGLQVIHSSS
jgi:hypothetical protein